MDETEQQEKKREPRKNALRFTDVVQMAGELPTYEKSAFLMIGYRNGVRLAIPKNAGVKRAFFYANDDYDLIPDYPAIIVYTPETRKEEKLGGIMARIDFEQGLDLAEEALRRLIDVIRTNPAPVDSDVEEPAEETLP